MNIKKNMGWCDDLNSKSKYNKIINLETKVRAEKLFRYDYKYDYFIPIKYIGKIQKLEKVVLFLYI